MQSWGSGPYEPRAYYAACLLLIDWLEKVAEPGTAGGDFTQLSCYVPHETCLHEFMQVEGGHP